MYNKALHIISSRYKRHGLKLKAKRDLKPLLVEDGVEAPAPVQTVDTVLGIDMGLTHLARLRRQQNSESTPPEMYRRKP